MKSKEVIIEQQKNSNIGDLLLGWDTDQFPNDVYDATLAMYEVLKAGGFTTGGLNFDSKARRASFKPEDVFISHIVLLRPDGARQLRRHPSGQFALQGRGLGQEHPVQVVWLAKQYNANIMVDEAHGIGVLGNHGRGTCDHFGVSKDVDLIKIGRAHV